MTTKEWIETNELGSLISGTTELANQRNYHSHYTIVNASGDRVTLVNNLETSVSFFGKTIFLSANFYSPTLLYPRGDQSIVSFDDLPWPTWKFRLDENNWITKEILFVKKTNRVLVRYQTNASHSFNLKIRPQISGRSYFGIRKDYSSLDINAIKEEKGKLNISLEKDLPSFTLAHNGTWTTEAFIFCNNYYPMTADRQEEPWENLWSPGELNFNIDQKHPAEIQFYLSSEESGDFSSWMNAEKEAREKRLTKLKTKDEILRRISYHAEDFLFTRADGKNSILAGFPWFLDWGRDSFIALEGLLLVRGKVDQAYNILKHFASYEKKGLLPNMFPNLKDDAIYNSVDAPMLFIKSAFKTLEYGANEKDFVLDLWPCIVNIINAFIKGTSFNILVDSKDGLVYAGVEGMQLTWMDAKVNGKVITPRIGKPIEINALWYFALKNSIYFAKNKNIEIPSKWNKYFNLIKENFIPKFLDKKENLLRDVVDALDPLDEKRLRPNCLYALVFASELFSKDQAKNLLSRIENELLTPFGMRTLSPFDPSFKARYEGDIIERDHAYHQGTVWPFLLGIYTDALLLWRPELKKEDIWNLWIDLLQSSQNFSPGHTSEIFDATAPQRPQGCFAQAWSDAELLRIAYNLNLIS